MSKAVAPSAWGKVPTATREIILRLTTEARAPKNEAYEGAANDKLYDAIIAAIGLEKHPFYGPLHHKNVSVRGDIPHAGSTDFVEMLRTKSEQERDNSELAQIVRDIDTIHNAATSIANQRAERASRMGP